jgi:glycosyltransferase involved in cell wall biosynthesis
MLVGRGELGTQIADKIKHLHLKDRVIRTGVRSDVSDLLQAMDAFLFPSLYEGLGIAVVEAQAAGLPCFIADTIPEEVVIAPLVRRLSVKAPPRSWADAILNHAYGARMNTRQAVIDAGYDIETTVLWLSDFYERIVENSRKGLA